MQHFNITEAFGDVAKLDKGLDGASLPFSFTFVAQRAAKRSPETFHFAAQ